jgi:2-haloacid dehalogenase
MNAPKWLTFDAYGTLIDFDLDSVILRELGERLEGVDVDEFLQACARDRFEEVLGEYRPYRDVLRSSLKRTMDRYGISYRESDGDALVAAVPTFGPFPDVPPVLERLREHCKLAIISNTEDDLIAGNMARLGAEIDRVITAEQAGAYKPSLDAFRFMLRELGCEEDEIVHIAQGFDYDIVPAAELGWRRIWINRRAIPGDPAYGPYVELPDLTGVPNVLGFE